MTPLPHPSTPVYRRVFSRCVRTPDGCLEWTGAKTPTGYGVITVARQQHYTHRAVLEWKTGKSMKGLVTRHSCHNPSCCDPNHLEPGTQRENALDMMTSERSGKARITLEQARDIKLRLDDGQRPCNVAREIGCSEATVRSIKSGRSWTNALAAMA